MTSASVIQFPTTTTTPPPTTTTPMFPNLKTKIVITQSIFELGP